MPEIKPQPFDIESHLHHITRRWGEIGQPVMVELVFLSAEDKAEVKHVARYRPDQIGQAAEDAAAMNALGVNVYCAINPIDANNQPKAGHRASREHIVGAFYHWADADDAQAAENIRNFVGPKCTMHVLTGTQPCMRPHVYWELVEFTRNLPEWEARQKAIAATLRTDSTVTDAPRIMRLAGTINWPKPAKRAKGYIAEVTTLRVYDPLERPPVSAERMARAFVGAAPSPAGGLQIDTGMGATAMDRALATAQIKAGENWRGNVMSLVASYIARGWTDDEILDRCEPFTLPGYTVADTREDVAGFIVWTRDQEARKGGKFAQSPVGAPTPAAPAEIIPKRPINIISSEAFAGTIEPPVYVVDGVIQQGRAHSLTGYTGHGKTTLAIHLMLCVALGDEFCGRECESGSVLFLAGENPDNVKFQYAAAIAAIGKKANEVPAWFLPGHFQMSSQEDELHAQCGQIPNLRLIVIDSLQSFFEGESDNSNVEMIQAAQRFRRLAELPARPAVIVIAHPAGKRADKSNLVPRGGSAFTNELDGNFTVWAEPDNTQVMHWEGKHRGAPFEPLNLIMVDHEFPHIKDHKGRMMPLKVTRQQMVMEQASAAKKAEDRDMRLLELLDGDARISVRAVSEKMRISKSTVARAIQELQAEKLIRRHARGWHLTDGGKEYLGNA